MKVALESIGDGRVKKALDKEIDTLVRLTSALLEQKRLTTQQDVLNTEEVALHAWIAEACEPFRRSGAPIRVVLDGRDGTARFDRTRMDMAIRNLVDNALAHAPGSPIVVELRTVGTAEGAFVLEVRDEGPGIPDQYLKRIGEPFLLVDKARSGTRTRGGFGLGLSIVRAVAEAHGAAFTARNLAPCGFAVTLSFGRPVRVNA
jgi:signal transduction histidine kinase